MRNLRTHFSSLIQVKLSYFLALFVTVDASLSKHKNTRMKKNGELNYW